MDYMIIHLLCCYSGQQYVRSTVSREICVVLFNNIPTTSHQLGNRHSEIHLLLLYCQLAHVKFDGSPLVEFIGGKTLKFAADLAVIFSLFPNLSLKTNEPIFNAYLIVHKGSEIFCVMIPATRIQFTLKQVY